MITDRHHEYVTIPDQACPKAPAPNTYVDQQETPAHVAFRHHATTYPQRRHAAANHERKDTTMNDRLLTIAEVSEMLRGPIATLRWWRHIGEGPPSFKIGRRVFYRESDVLAWIELQAASGCGDGTAASDRCQRVSSTSNNRPAG